MLKNVSFTNQSQVDDSWEWNFGDGGFDMTKNPIYAYSAKGNYDVQLIANNGFNCPDTIVKTITVHSFPFYWIPNAFSPGNNDNINDGFGLNTTSSVSEYRLSIYNRWGEKIFESKDLSITWDGNYMGTKVQSGVYMYLMYFRDSDMKLHSYTGDIHLIK
ncbi:MAG: gliding motility-associated-like protein [Bacteroidia bacterium]